MNNLILLITLFCSFHCQNSNDAKKNGSNKIMVQTSTQPEDTLNDILNTVLEYPLVSQYFHFEENDKFAIYQNELLKNPIIKLKDERFFLINEVNKGTPYIKFTQLTENKDRQSYIILLAIPYEGVKGKLELEKHNNKWTVTSSKVTEN